MATSDERIKILQMIQDGKISAADGTKLLEALNRGSSGRNPAAQQDIPEGMEGRYVRVKVSDTITGKTKVSVNLPLSLVDAGLGIAANFVPSVKNVDVTQAIRSGMTGKIVDVTDDEGEHVEIFVE